MHTERSHSLGVGEIPSKALLRNRKTNAMNKTPKHVIATRTRLNAICDALVGEFVQRVAPKDSKEKSMEVFTELNDKWLRACSIARLMDKKMARQFADRIMTLSTTVAKVHRRQRVEFIFGSAAWIFLFLLAIYGIGKFCEFTLIYFYPISNF